MGKKKWILLYCRREHFSEFCFLIDKFVRKGSIFLLENHLTNPAVINTLLLVWDKIKIEIKLYFTIPAMTFQLEI
jgi:hypothetical protein